MFIILDTFPSSSTGKDSVALATGYPLGGTATKTPMSAFADVGLWAYSPIRSVRSDT